MDRPATSATDPAATAGSAKAGGHHHHHHGGGSGSAISSSAASPCSPPRPARPPASKTASRSWRGRCPLTPSRPVRRPRQPSRSPDRPPIGENARPGRPPLATRADDQVGWTPVACCAPLRLVAPGLRREHRPGIPALGCRRNPPPAMMYFSRLKTALILGICLLGVLLACPTCCPRRPPGCPGARFISGSTCAAAATCCWKWTCAAVIKERLDSLADGARQGAAQRRRSARSGSIGAAGAEPPAGSG